MPKKLPSDLTPVRKRGKPISKAIDLEQLGSGPTSPETKFDGIRAVTYVHKHTDRLDTAGAAVVLEALGLIRQDQQRKVASPITVACPTCDAAPRFPCKPLRGTTLHGPHSDRLAAARRALIANHATEETS